MFRILTDLVETEEKGIPDSDPRVPVWVAAVYAEAPCGGGGKIISLHNKLKEDYCQTYHN